ncbi:MAG: family 1 glycosylhydrolase, partial [Anaerolineales bacterium]|nr:family 1 glycosylhydrolase [Anaerolineales bacterium]MDW8446015.1 family 1 glycosylhydrolase [Anaerolineales bacterium]
MPEVKYHFPRGFLWGTATSSHQVEGNNFLNSWHWWEEQGRVLHGHKCGLACDWWGGRWREDFDRAAEGHQNAHRFSVEWSRIQPTPEKWDEEALEHYREMARGLVQRNMIPLVTLHHFAEPMWFIEEGAWENDRSVERFTQYALKVVSALKEYVNLWVTFNEPNLYIIFGYVQGIWPPGKTSLDSAIKTAVNLLRAHASAYRAIHNLQPTARVGMAHHYQDLLPAKSWSPLDRWTTNTLHKALNEMITLPLSSGKLRVLLFRRNVPEAKGTQDFFGLNYYTRSRVAFDLSKAAEVFARRFF